MKAKALFDVSISYMGMERGAYDAIRVVNQVSISYMGMEHDTDNNSKVVKLYQSPIWVWNLHQEDRKWQNLKGINLLYGYGTLFSKSRKNNF